MTWNRRTFLKTTAAAGLAATTGGLNARDAGATPIIPKASGADDPLGIRAHFPVARELAYLNTASMGPMPQPVHEALTAYADERMTFRNPSSRGVSQISLPRSWYERSSGNRGPARIRPGREHKSDRFAARSSRTVMEA